MLISGILLPQSRGKAGGDARGLGNFGAVRFGRCIQAVRRFRFRVLMYCFPRLDYLRFRSAMRCEKSDRIFESHPSHRLQRNFGFRPGGLG